MNKLQAAFIYSTSGCQHFARLDLVGHGTDDNLGLILGSDIITKESLFRYATVFDGLDQYFDTDSFLWIMGCGTGGNEDILRHIAAMTGVSTWAGIGDVNPGGTSDCGLYMVSEPSGHCVKSHRVLLRNHARTNSQLWLDRVVPLGESFVALQSK